jgi:ABC-type multidrug transport system ATPase subunit
MSSYFRMRGVEGTVKVNGQNIIKDHHNEFSRLSCYIMQEDALRPALTVKEAMTFVAHLRLGYSMSHGQKQKQVGALLTGSDHSPRYVSFREVTVLPSSCDQLPLYSQICLEM